MERRNNRKLKTERIFKGDVCVDIIYNFPNQTINEVLEDARILKIGNKQCKFLFIDGS